MNLNHECVRHMLLTAEEAKLYEPVSLKRYESYPLLSNYSVEEIIYTAEKLEEAGFVNATIARGSGNTILRLDIDSLTWSGHQFLDNIRDNTVWAKTKEATSKLASVSLAILNDVASKVATKMLGLE